MASKEGEGAEPLQLRTCVLRVSIHCEGCKKKVRRILQKCEGCVTIEIDSKQNKVTVTGNVEAETLIRKLLKSGKHAELWPAEKKTKNPDPQSEKEKNKGREQNTSNPSEHPNNNSKSSEEEKNKGKELNASKSNEQNVEKKPETTTKSETKPETHTKSAEKAPIAEVSAETDMVTAKKATEPIEKDAESVTKSSETIIKEASKSDTKPENSNKAASKSENDTKSDDTVAISADSGSKKDKKEAEDARSGMQSIHQQSVHHEPSVYQMPVYVAGYNVVHPTSSNSYYAPTSAMSPCYIYSDNPPLTSQGYNYLDNPPLEYYPNHVRGNYYGSMGYEAASSSSQSGYNYFNDEDPNSCSVM